MRPIALTLAGLDPTGGAGLAADLATFARHGVHGASIATVLTAQSTQGLLESIAVDSALIDKQLELLLRDMQLAAIKTGALGSTKTVHVIASRLGACEVPLVIDPVRAATRASNTAQPLLEDNARDALLDLLLPCATLVTPNAIEAEWLTGLPVRSLSDAHAAAHALRQRGAGAVLIKGGHLDAGAGADAVDVLLDAHGAHELRAPRIAGADVHGLGCALSAAITAELARGRALRDAVARAKRFVTRALARAEQLGRGRALLDLSAPPDD